MALPGFSPAAFVYVHTPFSPLPQSRVALSWLASFGGVFRDVFYQNIFLFLELNRPMDQPSLWFLPGGGPLCRSGCAPICVTLSSCDLFLLIFLIFA